MVKKSVQRGRSERRDQAYSSAVREVSARCENNAGGIFHHPAKRESARIRGLDLLHARWKKTASEEQV
jgi:hypothetical protein